jgi:hypothetical protein
MLLVPRAALPCVISAMALAIAQLERVQSAIDQGEEWPPDYDGNDVWVLRIGMEALKAAERDGREEVDLSGKPLWFVCQSLPEYVGCNMRSLSAEEYAGLKRVYEQAPSVASGEFPAR